MKVFLSATSLLNSYGGPAYSVGRLAECLANQGLELGLWAADGSAVNREADNGESLVRRLSGDLSAALKWFGRPDVIHDNGIWLTHNHRLAIISKSQEIPRIVSVRGMLEPWAISHKRWKKRWAWTAYQRKDLESATALHATSTQEAASIDEHELGPEVRVIPNGIDIPPDSLLDSRVTEGPVALFLGRLYPVKGLPILIEAWDRVRPKGWSLVIAGPDEAGNREAMEADVRARKLESTIQFVGQVRGKAKSDLFLRASLFVLPSLSESFGMSIAEALSFGVPVLTTRASPWPQLEVLQCGWRADPNVESFASALKVATSEPPESLKRRGMTGRLLVKNEFQWSGVAEQFGQLYEKSIR